MKRDRWCIDPVWSVLWLVNCLANVVWHKVQWGPPEGAGLQLSTVTANCYKVVSTVSCAARLAVVFADSALGCQESNPAASSPRYCITVLLFWSGQSWTCSLRGERRNVPSTLASNLYPSWSEWRSTGWFMGTRTWFVFSKNAAGFRFFTSDGVPDEVNTECVSLRAVWNSCCSCWTGFLCHFFSFPQCCAACWRAVPLQSEMFVCFMDVSLKRWLLDSKMASWRKTARWAQLLFCFNVARLTAHAQYCLPLSWLTLQLDVIKLMTSCEHKRAETRFVWSWRWFCFQRLWAVEGKTRLQLKCLSCVPGLTPSSLSLLSSPQSSTPPWSHVRSVCSSF